MPDTTPILALPVLVPNQAQPYVTHNEALRRLDILVQLSVIAFGAETPPALPEEGALYALGAAPVADWAGRAQMLAARIDGTWLFLAPQPGWRAWDRETGLLRVWDGAAWIRPPAELDNVAGVGIGTASDAANRLAVKSAATLFSHDGGGHQLKINKAGDTDTASLLFQSDWTGHAEMGLAGGTDFSIKVSADGGAWTEALRFDGASGEAFGAAVQANAADTSAGRIPKMGNDADFDDLSATSLELASAAPAILLDETDAGADESLWRIQATSTGLNFTALNDAQTLGSTGIRIGRAALSQLVNAIIFYTDNVERMRINSSGNVGIGTAAPASPFDFRSAATSGWLSRFWSTDVTFDSVVQSLIADRSGSTSFSFLQALSGGPTGDVEFKLRGDGNAFADGSWTGGGADYAEWFEWADGNPGTEDRRGISVVLDGDRIRPALPGEEPIGVISANPSVVGDGDIDRWKGKYLRDDFGAYLWEVYEVVEWTETVTEGEGDGQVTREVRQSHAADQVPEGIAVPPGASRSPQQRRALNPDYDPAQPYVPRAERREWDMVGLVGKLRLRKGQPVGARWIRMREVSADVEEWLVR